MSVKLEIRRGVKMVEPHKLTKREAKELREQALSLASYLKGAYGICVCRESQ